MIRKYTRFSVFRKCLHTRIQKLENLIPRLAVCVTNEEMVGKEQGL